MKKFRFLTAFVAFAAFLGLTGCSDDQAELLDGGQGPNGTIILNVNYTIPGQETKVFYSTNVTAAAAGDYVTINAENEDTGESLVIEFGNQLNKNGAFAEATVTYIDPSGNEYNALSPFTGLNTGVVKLDTSSGGSLTGAFSLIGYDGSEVVPADGVPFFSGIFENVPLSGSLPEPIPYTPPFDPSMKATIDGEVVDFGGVWTAHEGEGTTFKGNNLDPVYAIDLIFTDSASIEEGTFPIDVTTGVNATVTVGTDVYQGVGGSIIISDITENIATGTFTINAENESGTITVTAGEFKVQVQ